MKKGLILTIAGIVFLLAVVGIWLFPGKDEPKAGSLQVNGVAVSAKHVTVYSDYAELPMTLVMKNLGMDVVWVDGDTAEITYQQRKYILELANTSFTEAGDEAQLLLPPPGAKDSYCAAVDEELILDSTLLESTLFLMGIKVQIHIDYDKALVQVNQA